MKSTSEKHLAKRSGFTLIEIILVVVIIGILASIAVPHILGKDEKSRRVAAKATIGALTTAITMYKLENGTYPKTLNDLLDSTKKGYPFLNGGNFVPKDPWGKPYNYSAPGTHRTYDFDIYCTDSKGKTVDNWSEGSQ
jgi:general secretion pathway protein G